MQYKCQAESNKLLELLSRIPDHRKGQGKRQKLEHILYLSILAGLMGATDYKQKLHPKLHPCRQISTFMI